MSTFPRVLPLLVLAALPLAAGPLAAAPKLKVGPDQRHLVKADGTPFFYMGDPAWQLFHRQDRADAELSLKYRAAKAFTVVHAAVLADFDGLTVPNAYGHLPLKDL